MPKAGQLDFLEQGAETDQGVDPLLPALLGNSKWLSCSTLNCLAIDLQLSQSIVHTLFFGELKNLFMMIGETAPGNDIPVLSLSILDLPLLLVLGRSTDTIMASDLPLRVSLNGNKCGVNENSLYFNDRDFRACYCFAIFFFLLNICFLNTQLMIQYKVHLVVIFYNIWSFLINIL